MFAVIESGGKQYRVAEGDILRLESLVAEPGDTVELPVMLVGGATTLVGTPLVDGAKVTAEVLAHGRGDKLHIYKYKAKINYRRKIGHRQRFTEVVIKEIAAGSGAAPQPEVAASVQPEPEGDAGASASEQDES
jgi:large subunit ribosomal protein L21